MSGPSGVRRVFIWTPDRYTQLRRAWRKRPPGQTTTAFDRFMGAELGTKPKTVQRCRVSLGLKSNPRRVTR